MTPEEAIKYLIPPIATSTIQSEQYLKQKEAYELAIKALEGMAMPVCTIKVKTVREKAKWIEYSNGHYYCSKCDNLRDVHPYYCEECGAEMFDENGNIIVESVK